MRHHSTLTWCQNAWNPISEDLSFKTFPRDPTTGDRRFVFQTTFSKILYSPRFPPCHPPLFYNNNSDTETWKWKQFELHSRKVLHLKGTSEGNSNQWYLSMASLPMKIVTSLQQLVKQQRLLGYGSDTWTECKLRHWCNYNTWRISSSFIEARVVEGPVIDFICSTDLV